MFFLKNNHGALLIDLLVSFAIIALLSAVTIPLLKKYQPNLKLNATARNLATDLRYAQQLTVTEQKVHVVAFDQPAGKYDILRIEPSATTTVKTVSLDADVYFKEITGLAGSQVIFNFYGGVSLPGKVVLTNVNNSTTTINIKPSGYIKLEE